MAQAQTRATASALNRLARGARLRDGVIGGTYWRRGQDGALTLYCRVRGEREVRPAAYPAGRHLNADDLGDARALARAAKRRAQATQPAPAVVVTPPTAALDAAVPLSAWWAGYAAEMAAPGSRWSPATLKANRARVARHVAVTVLWDRALQDITTAALADALAPLRAVKPDTETKVRQLLALLFAYAVGRGAVQANPVRALADLYRATSRPRVPRHYPAVIDLDRLRTIYRAIERSDLSYAVRTAAAVQTLTGLRSGALLPARVGEVDSGGRVLVIPRARMKTKDRGWDHVVPLSPAAWAILAPLVAGAPADAFLFTGKGKAGHVTPEAVEKAYRQHLGLRDTMVPHGWRSAIKTLASDAVGDDGRPQFSPAWIDAVLDHAPASRTAAAYSRAQAVAGAGRVLSWWAEQLTERTDR